MTQNELDPETTLQISSSSSENGNSFITGLRQPELKDESGVGDFEVLDSNNITTKKGESFEFYLHSSKDDFDYPTTACTWQLPRHDNYSQCSVFNVDEADDWETLGGDSPKCESNLVIRYILVI